MTPLNAEYPVPYPWFPKLKRDISRLHLDVLHSHGPWFLGLLAFRIAKQHGLPHVSTYHTLYDQYAHYMVFLPELATRGILDWWVPEYYNQCDDVIVPSTVAEESLRSYGVTTPLHVIPTGVPLPSPTDLTEQAKLAVRRRFKIPKSAPLLLYVGRIAKEKNIQLVVDSFEAIADEFPDARLLLVGGGPELETWKEEVSAMPHGDRMIFSGNLPRHEIDAVYAAADLFVFGSITETQGLVIAESRAAGTPAVVAREGGAAETVEHGVDGLVLEPETYRFADAIRTLLTQRTRLVEMSQACLRNAPRYTPEAMAARVEDVYSAVIERNRVTRELVSA